MSCTTKKKHHLDAFISLVFDELKVKSNKIQCEEYKKNRQGKKNNHHSKKKKIPERSVMGRTVNADVDSMRDRSPRGIFSTTVETNLAEVKSTRNTLFSGMLLCFLKKAATSSLLTSAI